MTNCNKFLTIDSDKQFLLFQLPDVLPLIPPEKDRRRPEKDSKSDNSSGENKTAVCNHNI